MTVQATEEATDWHAEAERLTAEVARWKQNSRTNQAFAREQREAVRLIAGKLGVDFGAKDNPEILAEKLDRQVRLARTHAIEAAVFRSAAAAGADATALLDSRAFMDRAGVLDPEGEGFAEAVAELVNEAASKSPRFQPHDRH